MAVTKKKVAKKKAVAKKASAKPTNKPAADVITATGFIVTTKQDGRRRAGRAWNGTTEVAADELNAEQLEQLMADPLIKVDVIGE